MASVKMTVQSSDVTCVVSQGSARIALECPNLSSADAQLLTQLIKDEPTLEVTIKKS